VKNKIKKMIVRLLRKRKR